MNGWRKDKQWSDQFLPEIKSILGQHLISEPSEVEDQKRNTDLMILRVDATRVGCRVRSTFNKWGENQLNKYGSQFTIRAGRPSNHKTELTKIVEGWGNYFFYGFGQEGSLDMWFLCDLNVFRLWYNKQLYSGVHPGIYNNNKDNSSYFLAFEWSWFPDNFIIAKKSPTAPTAGDKAKQHADALT